MDEQSKFVLRPLLKRTLIGGLLSVSIAGMAIIYILFIYPGPTTLNLILFFICFVFLTPSYPVEVLFPAVYSYPHDIYDAITYSISLFFWIIAGSIIAYKVKKNSRAFIYWFLLYLLLIPLGFAIYFLKTFVFN